MSQNLPGFASFELRGDPDLPCTRSWSGEGECQGFKVQGSGFRVVFRMFRVSGLGVVKEARDHKPEAQALEHPNR